MTVRMEPIFLTQNFGWKFVKEIPYSNAHPMHLYKKTYNDGWDDGYRYEWTLYVPPFDYFGTWVGVEWIIEEERWGGFIGEHTKHTTFRGYLETTDDFATMLRLTRIK